MSNKNKNKYTVDPIVVSTIHLMYTKGYKITYLTNSSVGKSYNAKPIRDSEKALRIINIKKPKNLGMTIEMLTDNIGGTKYITQRYIRLATTPDNILQFYNPSIKYSDREIADLIKEAEFFTNIQFY